MRVQVPRLYFLFIGIGLVLYWACAALHLFPPAYLFKDYDDSVIQAWNWSFLPLAMLIVASGWGAVMCEVRGNAGAAARLTLVSLSLTFCAGLQSLAFWTLRGDFEMSWWAPNLFFMASAAYYLLRPEPTAQSTQITTDG